MPLDLSNWSEVDPGTNEVGRTYNRVTRLPIGQKSENKKQKLSITTNIRTGDFKVFATGKKQSGGTDNTDILIYSYDADDNSITINDTEYYSDMFQRKNGQNEFRKLNSEIKLDTHNIAKQNQDTSVDERNFKSLGKKEGYKSAFNQSATAPQSLTSTIIQPGQESQVDGVALSKSADTTVTPNTDIDGDGVIDDVLKITIVGDASKVESSIDDASEYSGNSEYLRYPLGRIPSLGYDYIQIQSFKYTPVGLPFGYGQSRKKAKDRLVENGGDIIQLPMIGSISETNAVSWSDDTINEVKNIAAGIAYKAISGESGEGNDPFSAVIEAFGNAFGSAAEAVKSPEVRKAVAAYFAGQAAGVPNILQRATGRMINNNLELLFNGPNLRSFNFAFSLRPRDKAEADVCRQIIRSLKRASAPRISSDYMFLETPDVFRVQYIYNSSGNTDDSVDSSPKEHPYMNKIKPCALTGLSVNYTPEGSYATYEDGGSMTGYDLSLSFKELEPVYQNDQLSTADNMGY